MNMNAEIKNDNLPNENFEDKSKEKDSEHATIQCRIEGSIHTINYIPKNVDDLKGLVCPQCGGTEFEII